MIKGFKLSLLYFCSKKTFTVITTLIILTGLIKFIMRRDLRLDMEREHDGDM